MLRSPVPSLALLVAVAVALLPVGRAASRLDLGTEAGTMVAQAVRTLGGTFVDCTGILPSSAADGAQVACARVPADMFGYFKMGVHGRLYEYLDRGTLRVAHPWRASGNVLEVVYDLHGGTLTVARERLDGTLYGIFEFRPNGAYASSNAAKP